MRITNNGYELIKSLEGSRNDAYRDSVGIWTIGIGFIRIAGKPVQKGMTLTDEQIQSEFTNQISAYETAVTNSITSSINQNQFEALVSFTWNLGIRAFEGSTLRKIINEDPNDAGIAREFAKWNIAGGKVIPGLTTRRATETSYYANPITTA